MKVNSAIGQENRPQISKSKKELSNDEILAKVKEKFGNKASPKKAPPTEKVEVSKNAQQKAQVEEGNGDIGKNDPKSEVTREKLRAILKTGGFSFSDSERTALNKILN